jgi:hypothetical protein
MKALTIVAMVLCSFAFGNTSGSGDSYPTNSSLLCKTSDYQLSDFVAGGKSSVSPDNSMQVLLAKDFSFRVMKNGREIGLVSISDLSSNIGIVWAPDSIKFALTYSDGGAIGTFRTHVYQVSEHSVTELAKPVAAAFDEFKSKFYCPARGDNVLFIGWAADSQALLIVGQVYPTSDCGDIWGTERGYLVDLTGNVLRRYDDKQATFLQTSCEKSGHAVLPRAK